MKRRPHGVNLDDGIELSSQEEFEQLYVPARPEEEKRLLEWLTNPNAEAILLAGQIGAGKTTLLNNALRNTLGHGIVHIEFDQTPLDETEGAFLAVLFASLLKEALVQGCSCDSLGIALSDFGRSLRESWETLRDLLLIAPTSVTGARRVRKAYAVFDESPRQGQRACGSLIERIRTKNGSSPSIIVEGVDKFPISRAGYVFLVGVLDFLSDYKTLYEANAIHMFDRSHRWATSDKLFIGTLRDETIVTMYERRLGSYAAHFHDAFPSLVHYAGGVPRQAIRLLNEYYFRKVQRGDIREAAMALAMHRVAQDLLQFGFERFPTNILAILKRDGFVEPALLERPDTAEDTRLILYRNWALVKSTPLDRTTRWPVVINPLVSDAVVWEKSTPEPPELAAVRQWARDHYVSPMGLNMPEGESGEFRNWNEIWEQLSSSESSKDELNIIRLLDEVASSLFSINRQDRIMVSYHDPQNLNIVLDYLIGKAETFGPFAAREIHLKGGDTEEPFIDLIAFTKKREESTVYVVYMEGDWTDAQLDSIDRIRDRLVDLEMLWFVDHGSLLRYMSHWPQFRQLLRFYVLENDFLAPLSQQEIAEDLALLRSIEGEKGDGVNRLQRVLNYLKEMGSGHDEK